MRIISYVLRQHSCLYSYLLCLQVIRTSDTSDATFQSLLEFSKAMKKVPVVCKVRWAEPVAIVTYFRHSHLLDA